MLRTAGDRLKLQLPEKTQRRADSHKPPVCTANAWRMGMPPHHVCIGLELWFTGCVRIRPDTPPSWTGMRPCDLLRATVFSSSDAFDAHLRAVTCA
jgi:hypothetical protein